jgi:lipopolysaccharide transport system permease protein
MAIETPEIRVSPAQPIEAVPEKRRPAPHLVIQPSRGWGALGLRELWEYRELIYFMLWRDVKGRYRQMALGGLWIIIQPVMTMLVFSAIFGGLAKIPSDGLPYPLFSFAAVLPWKLFSGAIYQAAASLTNNMHIISKIYFPRLVVPITGAISGLVDFAVSFLVLLGMMFYYGVVPQWAALTLPYFVLLAVATALAGGLWLAALNVRFRDVSFGLSFAVTAWMYASPVVYPTSLVIKRLAHKPWLYELYQLNPMAQVIEGFRWALLGKGQPPGIMLLVSSLIVLIALITGAFYFRRTERTVVDLL